MTIFQPVLVLLMTHPELAPATGWLKMSERCGCGGKAFGYAWRSANGKLPCAGASDRIESLVALIPGE